MKATYQPTDEHARELKSSEWNDTLSDAAASADSADDWVDYLLTTDLPDETQRVRLSEIQNLLQRARDMLYDLRVGIEEEVPTDLRQDMIEQSYYVWPEGTSYAFKNAYTERMNFIISR